MRGSPFAAALAASCCLAACGAEPADDAHPAHQGRYLGIGIYPPAPTWPHLAGAPSQADPARARLDDDDKIIVTVDSRTGELRQCGNLSGYCISANPWRKPLSEVQSAPQRLTRHLSEINAENEQEAADTTAIRERN